MANANKIERTGLPSLSHGSGVYLATFESTTGTTTAISAAGDVTLTFATAFRSVPKILAVSLQDNQAGAAGVYPTAKVKTVSATALTVTLGGAVGTLAAPKILVLLEAEV